eukprot:CCRYP_017579-RA/>CCRYP_017579-RA protein AED:0.63 eAED:0.61 QI:0/0/0/0.5/0/0/2/0/222
MAPVPFPPRGFFHEPVLAVEPSNDPTEYILRVALISCDFDRVGRSLLFLNPGELRFLNYYHLASIPMSEFEIPKLAEIQSQIEYHVNETDRFLKYAKDAYGSYLIAYASHTFRDVYNVHDLNRNDVAAAFRLLLLPSICDGSNDEVSVGSSGNEDEMCNHEYREGNAHPAIVSLPPDVGLIPITMGKICIGTFLVFHCLDRSLFREGGHLYHGSHIESAKLH